jgi:transglutaminase-like putative cysteine protease
VCAEGPLSESEQAVVERLPSVPRELNGNFRIVRKPSKVVRTKLAVTIGTPSFQADTWIFAMPETPTTDGQKVRKFATSPTSKKIVDNTSLKTPIRICRIDVKKKELRKSAKFQCDAEILLYSRSLISEKSDGALSSVEPLSGPSRALYLRPSVECDFATEAFKNWKQSKSLTRIEQEGEVAFAKRVFKAITNDYQYLYVPEQNRAASALCQTDKTDCGGLSILFTSVMRSEGIPARVLSGRWAKSATDGETLDGQRYYQYHVIAEFYADGVGWVPLDPSSAILHDKSEAKLTYFGQDPGNFVVLHIDTGIDFDTQLYDDYRTAFFQIPLFWVKGNGTIENRTLKELWEVSPLTPGPSPTRGEGS